MKTIAELKNLDKREFDKELTKARREVMKLRFEAKTGKLAGSHKLHSAKKYVAKMLTAKNSVKNLPTAN